MDRVSIYEVFKHYDGSYFINASKKSGFMVSRYAYRVRSGYVFVMGMTSESGEKFFTIKHFNHRLNAIDGEIGNYEIYKTEKAATARIKEIIANEASNPESGKGQEISE